MQHFCNGGHLYNPQKRPFYVTTMSISFYIQVCHQIHKKNPIQNSMNVDSDKAGIFHLSFVQNPKLHHEKEPIDRDYTTDFFLIKYIQWMNFPHPKQHICHFQLGQLTSENLLLPDPRVPDNPTFKFTTLPDPTRS